MKWRDALLIINTVLMLTVLYVASLAKEEARNAWWCAMEANMRIARIEKSLGLPPDWSEPFTPPPGKVK